ncbi:MAG: tetraacyldisaccharide 4'-kinase, partial [Planctomycetaceae bacterium]|nr:tetraacyldisaccharide 4'-kinase [Planctomycetaceae bacterium]
MDVRRYLDVIAGREHGWRASLLRTCLALAVPGYALAVAVRNWLFDVGIRPQHTAKVPVVSVGNLTTGGTGKTPIVAWIAAWFGARGIRPCLVSRGFRSIDASGNDELRVLAQLCPDVPHIQKPDRVAGAREAVDRHAADVVILDDGFQHRRLRR